MILFIGPFMDKIDFNPSINFPILPIINMEKLKTQHIVIHVIKTTNKKQTRIQK